MARVLQNIFFPSESFSNKYAAAKTALELTLVNKLATSRNKTMASITRTLEMPGKSDHMFYILELSMCYYCYGLF